jgi:hypothetical protein
LLDPIRNGSIVCHIHSELSNVFMDKIWHRLNWASRSVYNISCGKKASAPRRGLARATQDNTTYSAAPIPPLEQPVMKATGILGYSNLRTSFELHLYPGQDKYEDFFWRAMTKVGPFGSHMCLGALANPDFCCCKGLRSVT